MNNDYPILEFNGIGKAVLEPSELKKTIKGMPKNVVLCFFGNVIEELNNKGQLKIITELKSEMGKHFVYEVDFKGQKVAVLQPGVGAPFAVAMLEEIIAIGGRKIIVCGGAGSLKKDLPFCGIVIPQRAVRDEGTSYHYLPAAREVEASIEAIRAIEKVLRRRDVNYIISKTWTTDAIYRETRDKINLRINEGCTVVEMECAALYALGKFREVKIGQILYCGDDLSSDKWDSRNWTECYDLRKKIFWLAVESSLEIY